MLRTTRKTGALDRLVAATLTVALAGYWIPATSHAAETASPAGEIGGTVLLPDGLTPVAGVSVKAANVDSEKIYTSTPTGRDGAYRLTGLPAGTYDLAVESSEGIYAADTLVRTIPGKRVVVSLAITKGAQEGQEGQEGQQGEGEKPKEGDQTGQQGDEKKADEGTKQGDSGQAEPEGQKKKRKGGSFWRTPWAALVGIVPGAILLGVAANAAAGDNSDDDEDEPNCMTPPCKNK